MTTRRYCSPLGRDIDTSKANKGMGWKGLKGHMALALAVSLWIAGGGVVWAEEVTVLSGQSVEYINCSGDENTITVESGGSVTGNATGSGSGSDAGASINGGVNNNNITISGTVKYRINGGYSSHGEVTGNQVTISGLAKDYVFGGNSAFGAVKNNHVTLLTGGTVNYTIMGGQSYGGVEKNIVTIAGGTVKKQVYGAKSTGGDALENEAHIQSGTVTQDVYGGYTNKEGAKASGNVVVISGGTVGNYVYGGYSFSGQATGNKVNISGGTVNGDVYGGGTGSGSATGNLVTLGGGTMNKGVYGGSRVSGTGDIITGNVLNLYGTSTVAGIVGNFEKITLDKDLVWNTTNPVLTAGEFSNFGGLDITAATNLTAVTTPGTMTLLQSGTDNNFSTLNLTYKDGTSSSTVALNSNKTNQVVKSEAKTSKNNGVTLAYNVNHTVSLDTAAYKSVSYTVANTLNSVDLTGWNGTTGSVPAGWTSALGANSITATNFAPNVAAGTTKDILTATTNDFFAENQIAEAIKYKAQASSTDTANGVALTGSESKGVTTADSGTKLVYKRSNFNVNNISFGKMTWGTKREADTGYDYTGVTTVNMDGLTFSNPADIAANSSKTLLTANNTLGEIAETIKNISYGYSPVDGVTVNGIINGSYKAAGGEISYTATANQATKLTFGNVAWKDTGALMTRPSNITFNGAAVDTSNINFTNIKELEANKTMTLVSDFGNSVGAITGTKYKVGSTLQGEGKASLVDSNDDGTMDALIFTTDTTAEKMTVQEQTHNTVMGAEVGMAALSAGNDFVGAATEGLAMAGNTGTDGMATYANMGGGSMNVETGSHVKTHTWNAILALGHKNEKKLSTTEYGAFFEYGTGNYSTFNGDERGDGSTRYTGGGILGKWQKNNGFYVEGSLRAGSIHDDANNVLRDANGNPYSYTTDATYWGAHIGVGREIKLNKTAVLDLYAKYFYNHRGSVSFDAGGHYDLGAVESSVLRVGTRYTVKQNDNINYYGGLAVEHEFCGRASGFADGVAIRGADISGTSVRGEIGAKFKPDEKSNVTLDLNLSGFAGKKQGFTGGLSAVFHI